MGELLMRRREMIPTSGGGGGGSYQLEQGTVTSGARSITVSGNHITIQSARAGFNSLTPIGFGETVVNNQPVWFTIPSGSSCVLKYLNIVSTTLSDPNIAMNFRNANASTSVSGFSTGNFSAKRGTCRVVSATASSNIDVGSLFLYCSYDTDGTIEFDFELYVDGVQWIGEGGSLYPLYPLDGTYITSGPSGTLMITDNSHWNYAQTQNGNLSNYAVFLYPEAQFKNKNITYRVEVSNFNVISGSIGTQSIKLGTAGAGDSQIITLFTFSDGDGTYTITHNLTYAYQGVIRLFLTEGWTVPWEAEFDFKLYADDVWIS